MDKQNKLSQPARYVIRKIIYSPIISMDGLKLSWDTTLKNQRCLNILGPTVLRQYYSVNVDIIQ